MKDKDLMLTFEGKLVAKFTDSRECMLEPTEIRVLYSYEGDKIHDFSLIIPKYGMLSIDYEDFIKVLEGKSDE